VIGGAVQHAKGVNLYLCCSRPSTCPLWIPVRFVTGTYNALLQNDTTTPCVTCPTGFATSQTGGTNLKDCNLCLPGYGDSGNNTDCAAKCGGENGANFGPAGRDALNHRCTNCPAGGTKFSFDYMADNMVFIPDSVARIGADSPADCLAEFAQILDDTW